MKKKGYSKTCLKRQLSKIPKFGFQDQFSPNADQEEHSAILSTLIKLPVVILTYILSIFDWPFKTGFTVLSVLKIMSSTWKFHNYTRNTNTQNTNSHGTSRYVIKVSTTRKYMYHNHHPHTNTQNSNSHGTSRYVIKGSTTRKYHNHQPQKKWTSIFCSLR